MGIRPSFFFFYSINKELSNSKEEELSVYYIVDFFLVLFFGFESASCAETSRAGFFSSVIFVRYCYLEIYEI